MTANSPWNLKLRVVTPEIPDPVFTELPVSREQWERIREQARLAGVPADQWISGQLRSELRSIIAAARASFPTSQHPAEAIRETKPDTFP